MKPSKIAGISLVLVFIILCAFISLRSAFGGNPLLEKTSLPRFGTMSFGSFRAVNVEEYLKSNGTVSVSLEDGVYFFDGPGKETALIFYPGAQVEFTAYAPLMHRLAEGGTDCFLVKMPLNLAVLGIGKADTIISTHNYNSWCLAGHSLGGAVIANYAAETERDIDGLYLLASYPSEDVSDIEDVLYIYGERDGILDRAKLEASKVYAPENYREYEIIGGNHIQFGSYTGQLGDNEAEISPEEQLDRTAEQILSGARGE